MPTSKAEARRWENPMKLAAVAEKARSVFFAPVYAVTFQWIDQPAGNCHMSGTLTL
jgi:hypothetical protein